tara:strand:- start:525 stop:890 length:366 start_codon:yes stop_codon:yes gene_type:complete
MKTKEEHIKYLKSKGEFKPICSLAIFSNKEIELLRKFGNWFIGLNNGELEPFNETQKKFIQVFENSLKPETFEEKTWFKYVGRLKLEKEKPEKFKLNYSVKGDDFYSRDDYYKVHSEKKNQ